MRKILIVEMNEDGTVGGSHQCLHDIVRGLDRARFLPSVVFYENNRFVEPVRALGTEVTIWDRAKETKHKPRRGLAAKSALLAGAGPSILRRARFLRRGKIDLVHLNNTPGIGFEDWLPAARLTGIPIIAHARGPFTPPGSAIGRRLSGRFDRIIAISESIARDLAAHGIDRSRTRTIHDGIDVGAWRAKAGDGAGVRRALGIPDGTLLVLMAGHLRPWKGQDVVLDALSKIPAAVHDRIVIAFAGEATAAESGYERALHETVARHGLERSVRFLGFRDDVPTLMSGADVVLHASTDPEPFGLVVIEGMALGKIVVAARLGGPVETVSGDAGFLFDPRDPGELAAILERIAAGPAQFEAMKAAAARRAEEFDSSRNVRAIEGIYQELLGGGAR